MILGERSNVRIRVIKGKLKERENDFWDIGRDPEKGKDQREKRKKEKREKDPSQNQHPFEK